MNRKQRMMDAVRAMASAELNRQLDLATTMTLAACILAINENNPDFDFEPWFESYARIYPELLRDPVPYIRKAEEVAEVDIEIQWTK